MTIGSRFDDAIVQGVISPLLHGRVSRGLPCSPPSRGRYSDCVAHFEPSQTLRSQRSDLCFRNRSCSQLFGPPV